MSASRKVAATERRMRIAPGPTFALCIPSWVMSRRVWHYAMLPLVATLMMVAFYIYARQPRWPTASYYMVLWLLRTLPLVLLVRWLDESPNGAMRLRVSWPALVLCVLFYSAAIYIPIQKPHGLYGVVKSPGSIAALLGAIAAILAAVPTGELLKRLRESRIALMLAMMTVVSHMSADIAPQMFALTGVEYVSLVTYFTTVCGADATVVAVMEPRWGYAALIRSDWWEVLIPQACTYFPAMFICVTLYCTLVLQQGAPPNELVRLAIRVAAVFILLSTLNLVRLAVLFCYADEHMRLLGRSAEAHQLASDYHLLGGTWLTAFFVVTIVFVYFVETYRAQKARSAVGSEATVQAEYP